MLKRYAETFSLKTIKHEANDIPILISQYAHKLIEAQAALQHNYTPEAFRNLVELYQIGIQLYSAKAPKKAKLLKKKLNGLVDHQAFSKNQWDQQKPKQKHSLNSTMSIDSNEEDLILNDNVSSDNSIFDSNKSTISNSSSLKQLLQNQLKVQMNNFKKTAQNQFIDIVSDERRKNTRNFELRQKDLKKQQDELRDRILMKKQRKNQKSTMVLLDPQQIQDTMNQ